MCGIAGIYSYSNKGSKVDKKELRKIRDHMKNRGPDGVGEWCDDNGRIILGHRRLSIIDLSVKSNQPMVSACGRYIITYNGEIYNYLELKKKMHQKGCIFTTNSDTEVLLQLYKQKGLNMFRDLKGMYAIAVWDRKAERLILARDPHGIKPLYYSDNGKEFRFSSQVKSLLAGGRVSKNKGPAGEVGFYLFGSVPEPYTLYSDIKQLEAGTVITISENGICKKLSDLTAEEVETNSLNFDNTAVLSTRTARVRECLRESVMRHLVSDVPVGLFLSSGIDSTTLAGVLDERLTTPLKTITLSFSEYRDTENDESGLAKLVSRHYGTDQITRYIDEQEIKRDLSSILSAMDQPSIDGFNTWFVSKIAAEAGLKVAISGVGADELLGGYPSFVDIPNWISIHRLVPDIFRSILKKSLAKTSSSHIFHPKLSSLATLANDYPGAYLVKRGIFMPHEIGQVMDSDAAYAGLESLMPLELINNQLHESDSTPFAKVSRLESSLYMRNQLLRDADWAGMAHSLEIRTPFVDHSLSLCMSGVLNRVYGKTALLKSVPNKKLPDPVFRRKKTGFKVPFNKWLSRMRELDSWKSNPLLCRTNCHWSRRLAYVVYNNY